MKDLEIAPEGLVRLHTGRGRRAGLPSRQSISRCARCYREPLGRAENLTAELTQHSAFG